MLLVASIDAGRRVRPLPPGAHRLHRRARRAGQIGPAVVLSQTAQRRCGCRAGARRCADRRAWFGVGGVFLLAAGTSTLAAVVLVGLPAGDPRSLPTRSPFAEMVDAVRYVRPDRGLGLVALTTIGVVVIAFPYSRSSPTLADERYDVGARRLRRHGRASPGSAPSPPAPRARAPVGGPATVADDRRCPAPRSAVARSPLARRGWFWTALLALVAVGAAGLVFQTTTQSQMLALSDVDYHGRMQSMVVLGFSGFGLAALPLGLARRRHHARGDAGRDGRRGARRDRRRSSLKRRQHRRQLVGVELA